MIGRVALRQVDLGALAWRFGLVGRTALFLMALLLMIRPGWAAESDDEEAAKPAEPPKHFDLDLSGDASTVGDRSLTVRLNVSPFGDLEASGWRLLLERNGSHYVYTSDLPFSPKIAGDQVDEDVMLGYAFIHEKWSVSLYLGFDRQSGSTSIPDPTNTTNGIKTGPKGALEASYELSEKLSLEGTFERAGPNDTTQIDLKAPFLLKDDIHLGPQVVYEADSFYHQWQFGPSLSGLKYGPVELTLGVGFLDDSRQGPGAYGSVAGELRF